ncbi:MAG: Lrp/AsnC family transcriptional regulator [Xanthomonadales bacterium]|nr:Lrp/AsnC family transcriptional regulator [Xanthomonadales bacterium]
MPPEPDAPPQLDRTDQRILEALQDDARRSVADLAALVSLSHSPVWRRVRALEAAGIIAGYHAHLDERRLGFGVRGFVQLQLENHTAEIATAFEREVQLLDQVLACHNLSGKYDYQLEVIARSLDDFASFVRERVRRLPGVREIATSFSLREVKGGRRVPV